MRPVRNGDQVPDLLLTAHTGEQVSLAAYRGRKAVVLYFYPMDESPLCTAEACGFRDAYEDFSDAGAVVIGVSPNSATSHRSFAANHRLPFLLIPDPDGAVRKTFGVSADFGLIPGRVTYVIDKKGIVRHVFNSQLFARAHISEALAVVRKIAQSAALER